MAHRLWIVQSLQYLRLRASNLHRHSSWCRLSSKILSNLLVSSLPPPLCFHKSLRWIHLYTISCSDIRTQNPSQKRRQISHSPHQIFKLCFSNIGSKNQRTRGRYYPGVQSGSHIKVETKCYLIRRAYPLDFTATNIGHGSVGNQRGRKVSKTCLR